MVSLTCLRGRRAGVRATSSIQCRPTRLAVRQVTGPPVFLCRRHHRECGQVIVEIAPGTLCSWTRCERRKIDYLLGGANVVRKSTGVCTIRSALRETRARSRHPRAARAAIPTSPRMDAGGPGARRCGTQRKLTRSIARWTKPGCQLNRRQARHPAAGASLEDSLVYQVVFER